MPIYLETAGVAPQDEEGHVTVGAKTEFEMKFTVDVPTTADPGTHYRALLVATAPVKQAGGGAAVQAKIGSIILVKVLGSNTEKLTLESFVAPRFTESPPITLEARFKNESHRLLVTMSAFSGEAVVASAQPVLGV